MKDKYFTIEVRVALAAIVAIVLLFFGIKFLKGIDIFKSTRTYYVVFQDVTGLTKSNPVYANGYAVGNVKDIRYDYSCPGHVVVQVELSKAMQIPQGTKAELVSSMLGSVDMTLVFSPNPLEHLNAGDTIYGQMHEGAIERMSAMLPAFEKMLPKLDSILTSLNTLLADTAIGSTLHNVNDITADLKQSTRHLNRILGNDIPRLTQRMDRIGENTEMLTGKLNALDVASTLASINATIDNVNSMTSSFNAKLNGKDNSIGLLLNSTETYDKLNETMNSANTLLQDLQQHPKRYVHFSVFGKKDK